MPRLQVDPPPHFPCQRQLFDARFWALSPTELTVFCENSQPPNPQNPLQLPSLLLPKPWMLDRTAPGSWTFLSARTTPRRCPRSRRTRLRLHDRPRDSAACAAVRFWVVGGTPGRIISATSRNGAPTWRTFGRRNTLQRPPRVLTAPLTLLDRFGAGSEGASESAGAYASRGQFGKATAGSKQPARHQT
jgi:hypothetical protein